METTLTPFSVRKRRIGEDTFYSLRKERQPTKEKNGRISEQATWLHYNFHTIFKHFFLIAPSSPQNIYDKEMIKVTNAAVEQLAGLPLTLPPVQDLAVGRTLVIVPTYNEAENISLLVRRVMGLEVPDLEMLVVDDNSPDGTAEVVRSLQKSYKRLHLIQREGKLGLGTAYVRGFKFALERGYDFIMEMDADLSHDPFMIPHFLVAIKDADLVIGSRYLGDVANVVNWPLSQLILSKGASLYTRIITGMPVQDPTGGFKCFQRCVLESLNLDEIHSGGYSFQIEMNFKAWAKGFRIKEIPIVFTDRTVGKSKMSRKIIFEAIYMVWVLKMRQLFGKL
ncbi:MAG: polyprenol monophosphomannose synthase [Chloroherpetonaceae bacterium]|nr:polyprenol monophosphomannose synthase [Chloroherpetonaceae bacterium]